MKIDKNSKLYKVLVVVAIILLGIYYIHSFMSQESIEDGMTKNEVETTTEEKENTEKETITDSDEVDIPDIKFRNQNLLDQHYEKHGKEMGFSSSKEYEKAAAKVVANKATLHKIEEEDGDDVYYLEETNEFVVVSTDGYIRTYFNPSDGLDYFNRQ